MHFYFDTDETRCFLEELPSDTIVEGKLSLLRRQDRLYWQRLAVWEHEADPLLGHYSCLLWDEATSRYVDESEIGIHVEVQVSSGIMQFLVLAI